MIDIGAKQTDERLADLESRLYDLYKEQEQTMRMKAASYFGQFEKRDRDMLKAVKDSKVTEEYYKQWRITQIGRGQRFVVLAEDFAQKMLEANQTAARWTNEEIPRIYMINHNTEAYQIEQIHGNVGLNLLDENTVRRLVTEQPDLLPRRKIDAELDKDWNTRQFEKEVLSGIMQGENLKQITDRVAPYVDGNRSCAVRAARTAVTNAQNGGRQAAYEESAKLGIDVHKRWIATKDGHTREAHGLADGQVVRYDKPFIVGGYKMMFPGDSSAPGELVWNCRCTMRTQEKEGIEAEPRMMRVKDPTTGEWKVVNEMTYTEWLEWKAHERENKDH